MIIPKRLGVALAFMLLSQVLFAGIRLPGFFSSHMVLQQKSIVPLWGWASSNQNILINASWLKDTIKVKSENTTRWNAMIETPAAGGPYELRIEGPGKEVILLEDVWIGEVWLCSGQSNMEWMGSQLPNLAAEYPETSSTPVRYLQIARNTSEYPQDDIRDTWKVYNRQEVLRFSAIGHMLAQKLTAGLKVPVGIINSSWGGTAAEVWTPSWIVDNSPFLHQYAGLLKENNNRPVKPGILWNAMIRPLAGYKIAGVVWYQGESNVDNWPSYDILFPAMIRSWREYWGYSFPFYFVQIAPYDYKSGTKQSGALLREQQLKSLAVPNTGMVVVSDLVDNVSNIHPVRKKEVADRLGNLALAEVYGQPSVDYKSPVYDHFDIEKNKVRIYFKYLRDGLQVKGKELTDIYVAGRDSIFYPAKAVTEKNTLLVYSDKVATPVAVRFGFTDTAMPNLFNTKGLPVAPFRTDDWELK